MTCALEHFAGLFCFWSSEFSGQSRHAYERGSTQGRQVNKENKRTETHQKKEAPKSRQALFEQRACLHGGGFYCCGLLTTKPRFISNQELNKICHMRAFQPAVSVSVFRFSGTKKGAKLVIIKNTDQSSTQMEGI